MDENEKQKLQLLITSTSRRSALTIKFLKMITQQYYFLVSVPLVSSIIFLILSYSSVLFRNFNFDIFPLFSTTTTLERKKYAFLICNVVVAFLAKSLISTISSAGSSPTASSIIGGDQLATTSTEERTDHVTVGGPDDQEDVAARTEAEITGSEEVPATIPEAEEDEEELDEIRGEPMTRRSAAPSLTAAEDDHGIRNEAVLLQNIVSAEELNRKFDEFIRKMKEEIRSTEARRQLITAMRPRHLPKHSE